MRLGVVLFLLLSSLMVNGQDVSQDQVWVKLKVRDVVNKQPIENAQVVSYITYQMFATDSLGVFRGTLSKVDSLKIFSLGYKPMIFYVAKVDSSVDMLVVDLERNSIVLDAVDVSADKEVNISFPSDINTEVNEMPIDLRSDGFSSKPKVLDAVLTPVGFLHYHMSKEEKMKRNAREMLAKDADQQLINGFYNREIVQEVSEYEGKDLDAFIIYCNINLKVTSEDNPIIVKQRIFELKKIYIEEKQL